MNQQGDKSGCCHLPGEVNRLQNRIRDLRRALSQYQNMFSWERTESGQYMWNLNCDPWTIANDSLKEDMPSCRM